MEEYLHLNPIRFDAESSNIEEDNETVFQSVMNFLEDTFDTPSTTTTSTSSSSSTTSTDDVDDDKCIIRQSSIDRGLDQKVHKNVSSRSTSITTSCSSRSCNSESKDRCWDKYHEYATVPIHNVTNMSMIMSHPDFSSSSRRNHHRRSMLSDSFPVKLMQILENPMNASCIAWTENAKAFMVLDPWKLQCKLLPMYFSCSNRSNNNHMFWKALKVWGFQVTPCFPMRKGLEQFQHQLFQRDKKHLLKEMRRQLNSVTCPRDSPSFSPGFPMSPSRTITPTSSLPRSSEHNGPTIGDPFTFSASMQQRPYYGYYENQFVLPPVPSQVIAQNSNYSYHHHDANQHNKVPDITIPLENGRQRSNAILKGMMIKECFEQ